MVFSVFLLLSSLCIEVQAQTYSVSGTVASETPGESLANISVGLKHNSYSAVTDESGHFTIANVKPGKYTLVISSLGHKKVERDITVTDHDLAVDITLKGHVSTVDSVVVVGEKEKTFGVTRLKDVEGTAIYAGKKTEVVVMKDITANTATNNSRQIYAKVTGLNIWESDGAGIQLGIGGRGLSPNRTANFNTRQNGYDMSADALGYPESYYSPSTESLERIEVVRGAASLQYGTQFGGMINFKLKKGPADKKAEVISRQSVGSWGFFNTFNSVGGTVGKVNYYSFLQHKQGDGWRGHSGFNNNIGYVSATYNVNQRLTIGAQYTYMEYLAQQAGGLTEDQFKVNPAQASRTRNWFKVNWNLAAITMDYKLSDRVKINTRFFGLLAGRSALGVLKTTTDADPMGERDLWVDQYKNFGNETRLLWHYNLGKYISSTLLVGVRYYNGHTDRKQGLGNSASSGGKSDFQFDNPNDLEYSKYSFPNQNVALFAENIFQLTPKWSIIPGIRYESIHTVADGFYNFALKDLAGNVYIPKHTDEYRSNKRSFIIGGIGTSYIANDAFQFYANFSQNYRAINFNDMRVINPNLQIDPNLKDETGYSADIGLRGNLSNILNYDISVFTINYDNRIGTVTEVDTSTNNVYRLRTNIARSRNLGVETFVEVNFWRLIRGEKAKSKISVFSNLTYVDARYLNSQESAYRNKKVELAPNIIWKTGLTYKTGKFGATLQYSYTAEQFNDATNVGKIKNGNGVNGLIPAYYVMDFSAEYTINKYFAVFATINNLSDNRYYTRRADSYPGPGIIPSDARAYYLTVQIKL
jgi:Fe(3+) dicitrate transport protein